MALNLETLGLSATVTAEGISAPDYQTILDTLTGYFCEIYGIDAYLDPDSKDGQMVAIYARAIHDANNTAIAVYNSFSPSTGFGAALSNNVKINGLARRSATNSTVDVVLSGTAGTTITNGSVKDENNIVWNLPPLVTIGLSDSVTVTATCARNDAVAAQAGTISIINTPTRGWRSVTNPAPAIVGSAAEKDSELRARQTISVANPSITPFEAVDGGLAAIGGVTRHKLYENDTGTTNSLGLPPHSIAAIVEGGDATQIAQTIRGKKGQGVSTFGTTTITVPDKYGNPQEINFSRPVDVPVYASIKIDVFAGYTSLIATQMQQAVADYINSLSIGSGVLLSRVYSPANLGVVSGGNAKYYDITELLIGRSTESLAAANISVAFNESASCKPENIAVTVNT
ncbi:MAG: baseplate J/gp47 family protein [Kluyvera sp.]|uniref:baseplate J/gp47 family protein n=1 Tax=Kluyvera sp. TaxID=1538228 RepID=UPI003F3E71C7